MKNIIYLVASVLIAISFNACGSSSSSTSTIQIPIDVNCTTPATINTYIPLQSGDSIVPQEDNTTVSTYHDINGTKRVCLVSGSAYIER